MKDKKTILERANENIINFLTGAPIDSCQRRIQNTFNELLDDELEFSKTDKAMNMSDEELNEHFDKFVTDIADTIVEYISNELVYTDMFDGVLPKSLENITFADIALANWFRIIICIHAVQLEKEFGQFATLIIGDGEIASDVKKLLDEMTNAIFINKEK